MAGGFMNRPFRTAFRALFLSLALALVVATFVLSTGFTTATNELARAEAASSREAQTRPLNASRARRKTDSTASRAAREVAVRKRPKAKLASQTPKSNAGVSLSGDLEPDE